MSYNVAIVYALKAADHGCMCSEHVGLFRDIADMGPLAGNLLYDIANEAIDHKCPCRACETWLWVATLERRQAVVS